MVVHHNSNLIDGDRHFGGVVVGGCRDAPRAGALAAGIAAKCLLPYSPGSAGGSHQLPKLGTDPDQIVFRVSRAGYTPRRWRTSEAGSASPNPPSRADDAASGPMSDRLSGQPRSTHICAGNAKRLGVREGAMSNVRNWASTAVVASLILLAPIIAFVVVITVEMLGDVMARAGATAIWPVLAVGMGWVLLRKFGGQPDTSRLRSGGA